MLTPDAVPVDIDVLAIRLIVFLERVGQDSDFFRLILSRIHTILVLANRDATLNLSFEIVVTLFELALFTMLVVNRQTDRLLLPHLVSQFSRALRDATLSHLVKHLQLVEKFSLIADECFLFIKLFAQF